MSSLKITQKIIVSKPFYDTDRGLACSGACEDQLRGLYVFDGFKLSRF